MKFALRISDFGALVGAIMLVTDIISPASDRPSISTIRTVLDAVENLKSEYVKKPAK